MMPMEHFDIAVIGTGSGNSILDERYSDKRIAICEQGTFGGTCLNVGCIPTKMFVYAAEVAENARGRGLAAELIAECRTETARQGARRLTWQTAPDNFRAQAVYEAELPPPEARTR